MHYVPSAILRLTKLLNLCPALTLKNITIKNSISNDKTMIATTVPTIIPVRLIAVSCAAGIEELELDTVGLNDVDAAVIEIVEGVVLSENKRN